MFRLLPIFAAGCAITHHPTASYDAPPPRWSTLEAVLAHPVELEIDVIVSATWAVPRSGLLDLDHPSAAHLADEDVPIQLPVVRIRHPERGTVFIDSGVDRDLAEGGRGPVRGLVRGFLSDIEPKVSMGELVDAEAHVAAVLLTHLHLDHVLGLPDVPLETPVIIGPEDHRTKDWQHAFLGGTYRQLLAGRGPLLELDLSEGVELDGIEGAVDLFGDGAIWALPVPGHTRGSTAYLLNAPEPVLVLGDASHTCWGWENDVPPGNFSHDPEGAAKSFTMLRDWVQSIPDLTVVAGHTPCSE